MKSIRIVAKTTTRTLRLGRGGRPSNGASGPGGAGGRTRGSSWSAAASPGPSSTIHRPIYNGAVPGAPQGFVDVVRDFLAAHRELRRLFSLFRAGKLRFEDLDPVFVDDEGSVL